MGGLISPASLLQQATKAAPVVQLAIGIGGIVAVIAIAIVASFKVDWRVAVFGVVIMLVFMAVLFILGKAVVAKTPDFFILAMTFTWFCLMAFMAVTTTFFWCVFFKKPFDLSYIVRPSNGSQMETHLPSVNTVKDPERNFDNGSPKQSQTKESPRPLKKEMTNSADEELSEKLELQGDEEALQAIQSELKLLQSGQSPIHARDRTIDSRWKNADNAWNKALGLTTDRSRISRLISKLDRTKRKSCTDQQPRAAVFCDANDLESDVLTMNGVTSSVKMK